MGLTSICVAWCACQDRQQRHETACKQCLFEMSLERFAAAHSVQETFKYTHRRSAPRGMSRCAVVDSSGLWSYGVIRVVFETVKLEVTLVVRVTVRVRVPQSKIPVALFLVVVVVVVYAAIILIVQRRDRNRRRRR